MSAAKTKTAKSTARKTAKKPAEREVLHPGARVWRLPVQTVREPLKALRESEGLTVKATYAAAIARAEKIADELVHLGLSQGTEECGPVRVLHTDEELACLRAASARCGVDMRLLLIAGLRGLISDGAQPAPARRRRRA